MKKMGLISRLNVMEQPILLITIHRLHGNVVNVAIKTKYIFSKKISSVLIVCLYLTEQKKRWLMSISSKISQILFVIILWVIKCFGKKSIGHQWVQLDV